MGYIINPVNNKNGFKMQKVILDLEVFGHVIEVAALYEGRKVTYIEHKTLNLDFSDLLAINHVTENLDKQLNDYLDDMEV